MEESSLTPQTVRNRTWTPIPSGFGEMTGDHLILAGLGFHPHRDAGDKNFWYWLVPHFIEAGLRRITIISVEGSSAIRENQISYYKVGKGVVCLRQLPSAILYKFTTGRSFPYGWGVLERIISLRAVIEAIRGVNKELGISNLHLMDNFGPTTQIMAYILPNPISVSAVTKNGRRPRLISKSYSQISFIHPRLKVVAYTRAYQGQLKEWGVKNVVYIPWGSEVVSSLPTWKQKTEAKKGLDLDPCLPLYLWAGYITQIREADFFLAVDKAKEALAQGLKATFFFAFKPECYSNRFADFNQPQKGIIVRATSVDKFLRLRLAADVFYSPFLIQTHIIGPPLTWIEMMAAGVPIVTTPVGGVEEIVIDAETGCIASHLQDLPKVLINMNSSYREMRKACYDMIHRQRSLKTIAQQYIQLWFGDDRVL